jgi:hypothetical protein
LDAEEQDLARNDVERHIPQRLIRGDGGVDEGGSGDGQDQDLPCDSPGREEATDDRKVTADHL